MNDNNLLGTAPLLMRAASAPERRELDQQCVGVHDAATQIWVMLSKRKEAPTMARLWSFVEQTQNREIPTWISSGLAVAIAGLWTALAFFSTPPQAPDSSLSAEASCGIVGIDRDVSGATITPSGGQHRVPARSGSHKGAIYPYGRVGVRTCLTVGERSQIDCHGSHLNCLDPLR